MVFLLSSVWLGELFDKQSRLDRFIMDKLDRDVPSDELALETTNAFLVELGEFLNEVRAFKNWSSKRMSREEAFEEYIDGFHFLLSLGNTRFGDLDVSKLENMIEQMYADLLTFCSDTMFFYLKEKESRAGSITFMASSVKLFSECNVLLGDSVEDFMNYFSQYMYLGFSIGMSINDVITEYDRKNKINYERQLNGY